MRAAGVRRRLHAGRRLACDPWPAEPLKSECSRTPVPIPQELALELSAAVKQYAGETVVTDEVGRPCSPWELQRAVRVARKRVKGLPEGFRYHDLRHFLSALCACSDSPGKRTYRPSPPTQFPPRCRFSSPKRTLSSCTRLDRDKMQHEHHRTRRVRTEGTTSRHCSSPLVWTSRSSRLGYGTPAR